jgi:8-oxo-dGTP pyrophosphatase MutT (NUDIX family)
MLLPSLHELSKLLEDRLLKPLPGGDAHELFRAQPVGDVKPLFDHTLPPKPGGVIILLYQKDGRIRFPLTKRAEYTGAHSGQVSLPGGKSDLGEDVVATALRECEEEIGIDRASIKVIGKLSDFFVMPSNFMVTPVVAAIEGEAFFKPDSHEVVRIIEAQLEDIVSDDAMKQKEILAAGRYRMNAPHFDVDGEVVWGATAMMVNEFRMILREII